MARTKLPLIGPAYRARSLNVSAQRAVNCYLEAGADGAPVALLGTPGTALKATLGSGPIRGGIFAGGYSWFVSGNTVYRLSSEYASTNCGTIATSSGNVSLSANDTQILIVDGVYGYIIDMATAVVAQINDPDFPNGVTQSTYQDGFFIVAGNDSGQFFINETPNNGNLWNGLDFSSAEGSPDNTISIISDHRELWLIGSDSAEVWVNTGNADFPFERSGNVFIEHGCAAAFSLDKMDNTVFWLGSDSRGGIVVWRANGYTPTRVSNHAVEFAIGQYSTISDAFAFTYTHEGHSFYCLTFPSGNATWVYDASTNEWHERAWFNPNNGSLNRWRASCHVFAFNTHLVGDFENGNIYSLDLDAYSDNGSPIKRLRSTLALNRDQFRQFYSMLQIHMETGVGDDVTIDPQLVLRYSDDSGHTWSNEIAASMGRIGEYSHRAIFRRLGSAYNRVFEISTTDPVKFAVIGAVLEFTNGNA
jgi:hypothetical protein